MFETLWEADWGSLVVPFAYLFVLGGALAVFSTIYRKRKAAQAANLAPWFPPHLQRNIYLSLLHMEPGEKQPKVPDSVIRAALLRRAVEDINRIVQIRTAKQACSTLLMRGSVGDDLWQRFQRAEKEMEEELRDVVLEANALGQNWGQIIFQSANEIAANTTLRHKLAEIQAQSDAENAWWEERKATIEKELVGDNSSAAAADSLKPEAKPEPKPKVEAKSATVSDDDAVLVESSASKHLTPSENTPPASQTGSMRKKKKGKK